MQMLRSTFLFCIILSSLTAVSQITVKGIVIDDDTKEPLPAASLKLVSSRELLVTDETGSFQLTLPEPKVSDTLLVTHVGYRTYKAPFTAGNQLTRLVIRLQKDVTLLDEVTVIGKFWRKLYSPEELREDYEKFCAILEKTHTGLFDYLKEEEWQHLKDSSRQLFQHSLTHSEFYRLIAFHVVRVRDRHTLHGVTDWWYKQKQNIFPFNVRYFEGRLYVSESLVKALDFPRGSEIIAINGRTPKEIKLMIWPFIPADGYIETGKMASLNDYFPWYYSLFVEEASEYEIELRKLNGHDTTINTPGLKDSFAHLSFQQVMKWKKSALELQIESEINTAYFRIEDSRAFKDSIQIYFKRILDNDVENLIIDLRGGGGMRVEEHVAELYSYLIDKRFRIYEAMQVKSNDYTLFDNHYTYKPYGKSLKHIKEKYFDKLVPTDKGYYLWQEESYLQLLDPANIQFKGTIYILTDGRNYSASTDFTSLASQLDNVFIVGEETGGEYRSYVSGAIFGLVLPNSKIGIKIPTWKSILAIEEVPSQRGRGVMPDYPVTESLQDFIHGRDAVKEYVYELIRDSRVSKFK